MKPCVLLLGRMPELIRATQVFLSQSESCNTTPSQPLPDGTESHPQSRVVILILYLCALSTFYLTSGTHYCSWLPHCSRLGLYRGRMY